MRKVKLRILITIEVDKEIYPVPADEDIKQDIEDILSDFLHEQDGIEINKLKIEGKTT